ncbi:MAG: UDP-N-acetylmuramoyl-L-alanyl-D-glutamate--2,6-diaminopimelate ligase, partial [Casimicrobium sp.]
IATWLAQAYDALDRKCGFIGTVGTGFLNQLRDSNNTTPDAATVHGTLAQLRTQGAHAVSMEVSSHALDQARVAGVRFECAVFSNLTQDHLDYHKTMAVYGEAKAKLFTEYPVRHRIINVDDEFGSQLAARRLPNVVTYGLRAGLVRTRVVEAKLGFMRLIVESPWGEVRSHVATTGTFNAYNATAVIAALLAMGIDREQVAGAIEALRPAAGRLQRVAIDEHEADLPNVYVDYAHTPDALDKAIAAVRESCRGELWVVFGCGGDRDRSKRPLMGEIAAKNAHHVVVTSDNPRSEPAGAIIHDIVEGLDLRLRKNVNVEADRRLAIAHAIDSARAGDCVLIAGKGHENYQEIAAVRHPFSDVDVAREALEARLHSQEAAHAAH